MYYFNLNYKNIFFVILELFICISQTGDDAVSCMYYLSMICHMIVFIWQLNINDCRTNMTNNVKQEVRIPVALRIINSCHCSQANNRYTITGTISQLDIQQHNTIVGQEVSQINYVSVAISEQLILIRYPLSHLTIKVITEELNAVIIFAILS